MNNPLSSDGHENVKGLDEYNTEEQKAKASVAWLIQKSFGSSPDSFRVLFYRNDQEVLTPTPAVINGLCTGDLYGRALSTILGQDVAGLGGVLHLLTKAGANIPDDVTETVLSHTAPVRMPAHLCIIDIMMMLWFRRIFTVDRVVQIVSKYAPIVQNQGPKDPEDAVCFWINKICAVVRDSLEQDGDDSITIPEMEDVYSELWDLCCVSVVVHFYRPKHLRLEDICLGEEVGMEEAVRNIALVRGFCADPAALPHNVFHFDTEDVLYIPECFQPNVLAFCTDLLYYLEDLHFKAPSRPNPPPIAKSRNFAQVNAIPDLRNFNDRGKRHQAPVNGNLRNIPSSMMNSIDSLATNRSVDSLKYPYVRTLSMDSEALKAQQLQQYLHQQGALDAAGVRRSPSNLVDFNTVSRGGGYQHQQEGPNPGPSGLSKSASLSAGGVPLAQIKMQLDEKRRQYEAKKQQVLAESGAKRQELGKEAFFQALGTKAPSPIDRRKGTQGQGGSMSQSMYATLPRDSPERSGSRAAAAAAAPSRPRVGSQDNVAELNRTVETLQREINRLSVDQDKLTKFVAYQQQQQHGDPFQQHHDMMVESYPQQQQQQEADYTKGLLVQTNQLQYANGGSPYLVGYSNKSPGFRLHDDVMTASSSSGSGGSGGRHHQPQATYRQSDPRPMMSAGGGVGQQLGGDPAINFDNLTSFAGASGGVVRTESPNAPYATLLNDSQQPAPMVPPHGYAHHPPPGSDFAGAAHGQPPLYGRSPPRSHQMLPLSAHGFDPQHHAQSLMQQQQHGGYMSSSAGEEEKFRTYDKYEPTVPLEALPNVVQAPHHPTVLPGSPSPAGGTPQTPQTPSGPPEERLASPSEVGMESSIKGTGKSGVAIDVSFSDSPSPSVRPPPPTRFTQQQGPSLVRRPASTPTAPAAPAASVQPRAAHAATAQPRAPAQQPAKAQPASSRQRDPSPNAGTGFVIGSADSKDTEMQRRKEQLLANTMRRREQVEAARMKAEVESAKRRAEQQRKQEEAERKKLEKEAHRQHLLDEYKRKKELEAEKADGAVIQPSAPAPAARLKGGSATPRTSSQPPQRPKSQLVKSAADSRPALSTVAPSNSADRLNEIDGASGSDGSAEPALRLFVKPTQKSNRSIVWNALSYSCLAGAVNEDTKRKTLEELAKSDAKHFLVLFRDVKCQYRGLYSWDQVSDTAHRLHGVGPKACNETMMNLMFKYDSGGKQFSQIPAKHLSATIDGFTIQDSFWQRKKPAIGRRA